jgi:hypothetical protein
MIMMIIMTIIMVMIMTVFHIRLGKLKQQVPDAGLYGNVTKRLQHQLSLERQKQQQQQHFVHDDVVDISDSSSAEQSRRCEDALDDRCFANQEQQEEQQEEQQQQQRLQYSIDRTSNKTPQSPLELCFPIPHPASCAVAPQIFKGVTAYINGYTGSCSGAVGSSSSSSIKSWNLSALHLHQACSLVQCSCLI